MIPPLGPWRPPEELATRLAPFLGRQRWHAGPAPAAVEVRASEVLTEEPPVLVWVLVESDGAMWQVPLGIGDQEHPPSLPEGREDAMVGEIVAPQGVVIAYDALADPRLCARLLELTSGGARSATRSRPVGAEQSNSSVILDDQVILKLYRRLRPGRNPEVEMASALDEVGFNHLPAPVGSWRDQERDLDLALAQEYLVGASEGWALALTSLRDLLSEEAEHRLPGGEHLLPGATDEAPVVAVPGGLARSGAEAPSVREVPEEPEEPDPDEAAAARAGGDFGSEAGRLGSMTARLHVALAEALGTEALDPGALARQVGEELGALAGLQVDQELAGELSEVRASFAPMLEALSSLSDAGLATRVHGDYHLGQVLRGDVGWVVIDFEGEPARPFDERRRRSSPLRDVAGMLRSFHYASRVALEERRAHGERGLSLAGGWERRSRRAFMEQYMAGSGVAALLPSPEARALVLGALEVHKAAYETRYEIAHRPGWVTVPLEALRRLAAPWVADAQAPGRNRP